MICVKIVAHILGFGCCLEVFALMLMSKKKVSHMQITEICLVQQSLDTRCG